MVHTVSLARPNIQFLLIFANDVASCYGSLSSSETEVILEQEAKKSPHNIRMISIL